MKANNATLYVNGEPLGEMVTEYIPERADNTDTIPWATLGPFEMDVTWTAPQFTLEAPLLPLIPPRFSEDGALELHVERRVGRRPSRGRLEGFTLRPGIIGWVLRETWATSRREGRKRHRKALKRRGVL